MLICYYYIFRLAFATDCQSSLGADEAPWDLLLFPDLRLGAHAAQRLAPVDRKAVECAGQGQLHHETAPTSKLRGSADTRQGWKTQLVVWAVYQKMASVECEISPWELLRAILEVSEDHKTTTMHAGVDNYSTGNAVCWTPLNIVNNSMPYSHISKIKQAIGVAEILYNSLKWTTQKQTYKALLAFSPHKSRANGLVCLANFKMFYWDILEQHCMRKKHGSGANVISVLITPALKISSVHRDIEDRWSI